MGLIIKLFFSGLLPKIGTFFNTKPKIAVIVGLLIVLVLGGWWMKHKVGGLEDELAGKNLEIQNMEITIDQFEKATASQNAAIDALRAKGKLATDKALRKAREAAALEKRYDKEIQDLMMQNVPNTCEGSIDWLNEKAQDELTW
jgi:hypothetical protein